MKKFIAFFRYYRSKGYTDEQIRVKMDRTVLTNVVVREQKRLDKQAA